MMKFGWCGVNVTLKYDYKIKEIGNVKSQKYYIYKFVDDNGEVLYVGKTRDIKKRLNSHLKDKQWLKSGVCMHYSEVNNLTDMDIYETYYINKLKPVHNKLKVYGSEFTQNIGELNFVLYRTLNNDDFSICDNTYKQSYHDITRMWDNIYLNEDINLDIKEFLYKTNIAENCEFSTTIIEMTNGHIQNERDVFTFDFKMYDKSNIGFTITYDSEMLVEFPAFIYYNKFLPILQRHADNPKGSKNYELDLCELLETEDVILIED